KAADVDVVILGCTHYPLIRSMLQRELGRSVTLIAAAEELADEVAETLRRKGLARPEGRRGAYRFLSTGDPAAFAEVGRRFLQLPLGEVCRLSLSELPAGAAAWPVGLPFRGCATTAADPTSFAGSTSFPTSWTPRTARCCSRSAA